MMRGQIISKLIGAAIGLLLICAIAGAKMGWPWYAQAALWGAALIGMIWATWHTAMPEWRDLSQKGAQPGLHEGSHNGDVSGGGGD